MKVVKFTDEADCIDSAVLLSRREAAHLIAYLTAQLAGVEAPGCMTGACFQVTVDNPYRRYHFSVDELETGKFID